MLLGLQGCVVQLEPYAAYTERLRQFLLIPRLQFANACFDARVYAWGTALRMRAIASLPVAMDINNPSDVDYVVGTAAANVSLAIRPEAGRFDLSLSIMLALEGTWPNPLGLGSDFAINDATIWLSA